MSELPKNNSHEPSDAPEDSFHDDSPFKTKSKKNIQRVRFDADDMADSENQATHMSCGTSNTPSVSVSEPKHKRVSSFYIHEDVEVEISGDDDPKQQSVSIDVLENVAENTSETLDLHDASQRLGMSPVYSPINSKTSAIQLLNLPRAASSSAFLHNKAHATFTDVPGAFDPDVCTSSDHTNAHTSIHMHPHGIHNNSQHGPRYLEAHLSPSLSPTLDAYISSRSNSLADQGKSSNKKKTNRRHGREFYSLTKYAYELVRAHIRGESCRHKKVLKEDVSDVIDVINTGASASEEPSSSHFRGGVLSHLLKLYNHPENIYSNRQSLNMTPPGTGRSTPRWNNKSANSSSTSLSALLATSSATVAVPGLLGFQGLQQEDSIIGLSKMARSFYKTRKHSSGIANAIKHSFSRSRLEDEIRITVHLADVLQRQKFILRLCHALMLYGSPTHRLEECMKMTSRVLEIDGQFLYIPGCMIISFGDLITHTSDIHVVRVNQGLDIGKLQETHFIYKQVIHDLTGVEEAMKNLDEVMSRKQYYKDWVVILFYGFASALVGPSAYNASWIDLPISFVLGCILGVLKIVVARRSLLYANAFEISAAVITSFLARAFGSIRDRRNNDKFIFCFASMAESAITLILPGYLVLSGSLELQTKNIVAGSVRLFYAIIYSLFLGFGMSIGSVIYKSMDKMASNETQCHSNINLWLRFLFVPIFTICILVVNQARPRQFPVAVIIASAGYVVNFFSTKRFGASQVSNAIGAFVIGCLGNVYSRIGHGLAFTVILPAIFVQIPSGLAAQRGVYIGVEVSNEIFIGNASQNLGTYNGTDMKLSNPNSLSFGIVMIQIAIAITVGLFFSSILVYSFGGIKRRSALFSL
ncbi:hypothetical protein PORY_002805 [Pneumocystis oryctolagi]|uniref:Uncharacterized protein n=1 Tax=Pneumocystis oryctolagi TaxID=42067 RepID=A0ACB7C8V8_9ASCO|nr:hypothetical protein PORY_002805 [Pneumocystis oryctolagi]